MDLMDDRMRFRSANARIEQLVNDPLIAEDVQLYAEQRVQAAQLGEPRQVGQSERRSSK